MCVCARHSLLCASQLRVTGSAHIRGEACDGADGSDCVYRHAGLVPVKSLIFDNKNKNKKQRLPAGSQVLCATLTPAHSRLSDLLSSCRGTAKFLKFAQTRAHTQSRLRRLSENALMCPLLKSQRESLRLSHASKFDCLRKDN